MITKCPYPDCQKDFNEDWGSSTRHIDPTGYSLEGDGLWIETYTCKFCRKLFHEIFRAKHTTITDEIGRKFPKQEQKELLFVFPSVKTKFNAKRIPNKITEFFNEAERCRAVGSLTGVGSCLRKTVYAICDNKNVDGADYREKISNLPVRGIYQELLKQIKWLGDNTTKPGSENYTMKEADLALNILPILIEELFEKDEKLLVANQILAEVRSSK